MRFRIIFQDLAVEKGVVFVEVNYRRGPIGFLSVDDLSRYKKAKSTF